MAASDRLGPAPVLKLWPIFTALLLHAPRGLAFSPTKSLLPVAARWRRARRDGLDRGSKAALVVVASDPTESSAGSLRVGVEGLVKAVDEEGGVPAGTLASYKAFMESPVTADVLRCAQKVVRAAGDQVSSQREMNAEAAEFSSRTIPLRALGEEEAAESAALFWAEAAARQRAVKEGALIKALVADTWKLYQRTTQDAPKGDLDEASLVAALEASSLRVDEAGRAAIKRRKLLSSPAQKRGGLVVDAFLGFVELLVEPLEGEPDESPIGVLAGLRAALQEYDDRLSSGTAGDMPAVSYLTGAADAAARRGAAAGRQAADIASMLSGKGQALVPWSEAPLDLAELGADGRANVWRWSAMLEGAFDDLFQKPEVTLGRGAVFRLGLEAAEAREEAAYERALQELFDLRDEANLAKGASGTEASSQLKKPPLGLRFEEAAAQGAQGAQGGDFTLDDARAALGLEPTCSDDEVYVAAVEELSSDLAVQTASSVVVAAAAFALQVWLVYTLLDWAFGGGGDGGGPPPNLNAPILGMPGYVAPGPVDGSLFSSGLGLIRQAIGL